MSGGRPELGSKISLISKADIRYEGRLYTVDPQECTITLSSVRSFGTEDRETQFQIAPHSQVYDYILFRGNDIKDIYVDGQHVMPHLSMPGMNTQQVTSIGGVINNSLPHPNDPAIMQVQLPNGQQVSGGRPELGSKISLISKADIRYEGRYYTVDPQECTITLSSVRSFGTEYRETQFQIAPHSQVYDYILFRGNDIKDIYVDGQHVLSHLSIPGMNTQQVPSMDGVINNSLAHLNDPAIMQVQFTDGQHVMPHLSMPGMNTQQVTSIGGVINNSLSHPNDPAMMQVQFTDGQHVMPHLSMPGMNTQQVPPIGGVGSYGNQFEAMDGLGAIGGGGGGVPQSLAPGASAPSPFMKDNQQVPPQPKLPQNQQSQTQQQQKQPIPS